MSQMHTLCETDYFSKKSRKLLSDAEYECLISLLAKNPLLGEVMQGTGGVRKFRLPREGGGKSGGLRVIYFYWDGGVPIYLLDIFAKNQQANITKAQRNDLASAVAILKKCLRGEV